MGMCNIPNAGYNTCGTLMGNCTAMKLLFTRILDQFSQLYSVKAYLDWYTGEGMDEMEFQEAESNVTDLVAEYTQYEEATVDQEVELTTNRFIPLHMCIHIHALP